MKRQPCIAAPCSDKLPSDMTSSTLRDDETECAATLNVDDLLPYLRASGGSLVPDKLMSLRDMALLKKCLKDSGTSLPFLQGQEGNKYRHLSVAEVCSTCRSTVVYFLHIEVRIRY